jgi:hypothetical protein
MQGNLVQICSPKVISELLQVGFTRLSTTMSALHAVRLLNDIVSRVDRAAEHLGSIWKVLLAKVPWAINYKTTLIEKYISDLKDQYPCLLASHYYYIMMRIFCSWDLDFPRLSL